MLGCRSTGRTSLQCGKRVPIERDHDVQHAVSSWLLGLGGGRGKAMGGLLRWGYPDQAQTQICTRGSFSACLFAEKKIKQVGEGAFQKSTSSGFRCISVKSHQTAPRTHLGSPGKLRGPGLGTIIETRSRDLVLQGGCDSVFHCFTYFPIFQDFRSAPVIGILDCRSATAQCEDVAPKVRIRCDPLRHEDLGRAHPALYRRHEPHLPLRIYRKHPGWAPHMETSSTPMPPPR